MDLLIVLKNQESFFSDYTTISKIPNEKLHQNKIANIHIWIFNSSEWIRHIAFREYIKFNIDVRNQYQKLKEVLSLQNWTNGDEYNNAKNAFIKRKERKAIKWYRENERHQSNRF